MATVGYLPVKPFFSLFNWGMPDIAGHIMSFSAGHLWSFLLMGQFWGGNRSIKTISESVLNHFICNVNYLSWSDIHIKSLLP